MKGRHLLRPALGAAALVCAFAGAAQPVLAASGKSFTVSGQSEAVALQPLTLINVRGLDFGRLIPDKLAAGYVVVSQNADSCTTTNSNIVLMGGCMRASFSGMGRGRADVRVVSTTIVNLTGPGTTMVLDQLTIGNSPTIIFVGNTNANGGGLGLTQGNGNQTYQITSPTNAFNFRVGGRLAVNRNQAPGKYKGSFTITVRYQ